MPLQLVQICEVKGKILVTKNFHLFPVMPTTISQCSYHMTTYQIQRIRLKAVSINVLSHLTVQYSDMASFPESPSVLTCLFPFEHLTAESTSTTFSEERSQVLHKPIAALVSEEELDHTIKDHSSPRSPIGA